MVELTRFLGDRVERAPGASMAALLAAAVGLFTLAIVVLATELSKPVSDAVFAIGKAWIPNAQGIGPYSGKETLMLLGWLGSWVVLHVALRGREVRTRPVFGLVLGMLALATLLLWPPVWHWLGA
ncbi:MAG TPA: hypothetical protein VGR28_05810 [Candidatus Thermoplasmatota archaeon]|jgi:hypothetical protein|nr:hypothetical protein [Candidatus Thermoplasmatota archaeon]